MYYIIKGGHGNGTRWLQFSERTGEPVIQTRLGYRKSNVLAFNSKASAECFLKKYISLHTSNIDWEVREYKAATEWEYSRCEYRNGKAKIIDSCKCKLVPSPRLTSCGVASRLIIKTESI